MMGSPVTEWHWDDEKQHQVTLTKHFFLGKYPVTQKEYIAVMRKNPSHFKGDYNPVDSVAWYEAKEFCHKLNQLKKNELPEGYQFDLPTEAQWEYACRAGTTTDFNNGLNLTDTENCQNADAIAWMKGNTCRTQPVGQKTMNNWGLYDMSGNIFEWCRDRYDKYPNKAETDPVRSALTFSVGQFRVIRGGSWFTRAVDCRSAFRCNANQDGLSYEIGFRLALVPIE